MRNICALLALSLAVGCGGGDGKDGNDGAPGPQGAAGPPGADGDNGENGAPGADGTNGMDGAPGMDGTNGTNGVDGAAGGAILQGSGAPAAALGADGDIYIDTVSRDVYQKANGTWSVITNLSGGPPGPKGDTGDDGMNGAPGTNGTNGADGADGSSVLTGAGAPAAGLGNTGDVYIDSTSGTLYTKGAGGWVLSGNLKGPAGDDGADGAPGADGVDVKDTLGGVRWFAFALNASFADTPSLLTGETYTDVSASADFTFTGASQHGRLAFHTAGSFLPGGVNLTAYDFLDVTATVTGGATTALRLHLSNGDNVGCQYDSTAAAGPDYSFDLWDPSSCYNTAPLTPDFTLENVTTVQIGIQSSAAGTRTLTVTNISLVPN